MQARDAKGRQVSLLNDDSGSSGSGINNSSGNGNGNGSHMAQMQFRGNWPYSSRPLLHHHHHHHHHHHQHQAAAHRSGSSTPSTTPELLRSNSYDSQMSTDPTSPMTPSLEYQSYSSRLAAWSSSSFSSTTTSTPRPEFGSDAGPPPKRPSYDHHQPHHHRSRTASYEEDSAPSPAPDRAPERTGKRYHCRYRDSHGCEKTFTTSGHASRHSKIHTAEKAVQCKFEGCQKKFTRADNMKQHLETHFKTNPKSRPSPHDQPRAAGLNNNSNSNNNRSIVAASQSPRASNSTTGTIPPPPGRRRASTTARARLTGPRFEPGQDAYPLPPLTGGGSGLWLPTLNQSSQVGVGGRSGLDTLALAVERYKSELNES